MSFPSKDLIRGVLLLLLCGAAFCACSRSQNYLRDELANRGPLMLSGDNPYIAQNLLIAKELERSDLFKGFFKYRGTPDAVEVKKKWFGPWMIYVFYLDKGEGYLFEEGKQDWIIRGPKAIPQNMITAFGQIREPGKPALLAGGVPAPKQSGGEFEFDSGSQAENDEPVGDTASAFPAPGRPLQGTLPPKAVPTPVEKPLPPPAAARQSTETGETKPLKKTSGQRKIAPNLSEATSGDMIHTVSYKGETLRIIASWFTDSPDNAERIARINGITKPNVLNIGQTVRIPRYLLKKSEPFPESEITRYQHGLTAK